MLRHFRLTCHRALFYSSTRIHEQSQVKPLFLCFGPFWNWLVRFLNPYRAHVFRRTLVSPCTLYGVKFIFWGNFKNVKFFYFVKKREYERLFQFETSKDIIYRNEILSFYFEAYIDCLKNRVFSQST